RHLERATGPPCGTFERSGRDLATPAVSNFPEGC
ncbi:MAG: hypothetical protein ACI9WU_000076, partial [Myxococcota bacterium]